MACIKSESLQSIKVPGISCERMQRNPVTKPTGQRGQTRLQEQAIKPPSKYSATLPSLTHSPLHLQGSSWNLPPRCHGHSAAAEALYEPTSGRCKAENLQGCYGHQPCHFALRSHNQPGGVCVAAELRAASIEFAKSSMHEALVSLPVSS